MDHSVNMRRTPSVIAGVDRNELRNPIFVCGQAAAQERLVADHGRGAASGTLASLEGRGRTASSSSRVSTVDPGGVSYK